MYNLSDEQMEFHLVDRLSFQRFLGLESGDKLPDAKTVWVFKERIKEEKEQIKNDETPEEWKNNPNKLCQKDFEVTDASVRDSQPAPEFNERINTKLVKIGP
ncbi:MAG: transposase [Leptospiraceae bacterium]|nr:transposase [Leptospiraceae bacterium]